VIVEVCEEARRRRTDDADAFVMTRIGSAPNEAQVLAVESVAHATFANVDSCGSLMDSPTTESSTPVMILVASKWHSTKVVVSLTAGSF
jgi:hypothetical protein